MKLHYKIEVHDYSKVMERVDCSLHYLRGGHWSRASSMVLPEKQFRALIKLLSNGIGPGEEMTIHFKPGELPLNPKIDRVVFTLEG